MSKCYQVANVDEAIDLATRLQQEKVFDLFRGQERSEWAPRSSLTRLLLKQPDALEEVHRRGAELITWLRNIPGLQSIGHDPDQIGAIAQHYGIPTNFLDFTTDPAVAGFFAADSKDPQPGVESCILCLDSRELSEFWEIARHLHGEGAALEIVCPSVPNLWRLEAQRGVFLRVNGNWDAIYPLDRIVFPYSGYPSYPTKLDIYPDRKSQLEMLLEHFFAIPRGGDIMKAIAELREANLNVDWFVFSHPPCGFYEKFFRCEPQPHSSWEEAKAWLEVPSEHFSSVWSRDVPLSADLTLAPAVLAARIASGCRRAMDRDETLRRHSVNWRLEATDPVSRFRPCLHRGLNLLWDGLRRLPLTNREIGDALGALVGLYSAGLDECPNISQRKTIFESVFGEDAILVGFSGHDGSGSTGFVTASAMRAALRPDLHDVLAERFLDRINDIRFLLKIAPSPTRLFDFRKLAGLFAGQVAPSQLPLPAPWFFSPARLKLFSDP